ncbi:hypothetical protein [Aeoliella mucimassa]|uniref:Poly(3-hydroxyalkanoate) polymerase subunit PhaE n=1 Tax=Aeoliella mucimassa TaxID=2527972 RepID=A0A518AQ35_9BACT|nr:hypothetical protein [Aeoliella mucimassa]QDU56840.1 hypothetical protein Pan181_30520 [Aeoliella mucimassa]
MSANSTESFNPFDPTGMLKDVRDAGMQTWAKMMVEAVNTDAYSEATGAMLDAWLVTSGPFREATQKAMEKSLAELNMPSREEITRLAGRLTNIEMRLDDLDAKLDEMLQCLRPSSPTQNG